MQILNHITLDFSRPNVAVLDYAVQGDEYSRGVVAQLVGGSQAWTPPAGAGAFVEYRRADGATGLYDTLESGDTAVTVDGSTATLLFSAHALQVSGSLAVALRFVDIDGRKLRSFEFVVNVKRELVSESDVTTDPYYNILSQQIAAVLNASSSLTGMTVSNTTLPPGSAATAAITGGEDGVPYNIDFGIPRGDPGPQGPKGDPGAGSPSDALPLMDGIAAPGTSDQFSRADHVHPLGQALFDAIYPVGSIYPSVVNINPETLFGGTWVQIKDCFLLAAGDLYEAGTTGGEAEHILSANESGQPALSISGGGHTHTVTVKYNLSGGSGSRAEIANSGSQSTTSVATIANNTGTHSHSVPAAPAAAAHNNMPPYLTIYVWKRTA